MSAVAAAPRDRLAGWCGWVVATVLALTPLVGWLGPLGLPILIGVAGLAGLPTLRISDEDRPIVVLLLAALLWAAVSSLWSPFHPTKIDHNTAAKLGLQAPLYWAAICAARRADPQLKQAALLAFALGSALFGVVLLAEAATDAGLYERLHFAFYQPIRHDFAEVNIGHASFVLALIWPLALAAAWKTRLSGWVALAMVLGVLAAAIRFGSDAPVISVPLAAIVFLAAWRWPSGAPKVLAWLAAAYWLLAPAMVVALKESGRYEAIQQAIPLSWSMRMGFWSHAVEWMRDHPMRGWGLDASRAFGPGIILHPHDDALQVWLELGAAGAGLAAALWWLALRRLARPASNLATAGAAASASVYLLFGALNFGAWQEWWLALGALLVMLVSLIAAPLPAQAST